MISCRDDVPNVDGQYARGAFKGSKTLPDIEQIDAEYENIVKQ